MRRQSRPWAGFTLIELMAVVLILAILSAVALPKFFDYRGEAQLSACKGTLGGVRAGIASFYANQAISGTAAFPTLTELTDGSTMQETLPENPYAGSNDVTTATSAEAAARTPVGVGPGWAYFPGAANGDAVFYANTNTAGVNENSF
ncbi:MAG: pilin [Planctomycetota bacterium]|jgi:MSHA pilin protein MshA